MGDHRGLTSEQLVHIYTNIIRNMSDGVISISLEGNVITFNEAASSIFSLSEKEVLGQSYANVFFSDPRNDEFSDVILKAIYDSSMTHHKEVPYYVNEKCKFLMVSSTFLFIAENEKNEKFGIILVISDVTERHQLDTIKNIFGKYIDPHITKRLIEIPEEFLAKPRRQIMTVSFCDMRNFTSISEVLPPDVLIEFMNAFFTGMSSPVHKNDGVIDKYIGDATLSFWGSPFTVEDNHAMKGCQAALDQIAELDKLNKNIAAILGKNYQTFEIRVNIGITTGEVVVGNVGSENFKSYTITGTTVNLAGRLVGTNKVYGTTILMADETARLVGESFELREIDTIQVIGKKLPTNVYELLGRKSDISDKLKRSREHYVCALNLYRQQRWKEAKKEFVQSLSVNPEDHAAKVFIERIEYFMTNPPLEKWDGVWRLMHK